MNVRYNYDQGCLIRYCDVVAFKQELHQVGEGTDSSCYIVLREVDRI